MITVVKELITKEKAIKYLAKNLHNRSLRSSHVDFFCKIIRSGDWKVTHQGIAFNEAGELLDGQHRLTAIALTGIPCEILVVRGVTNADAAAIDTQMMVRSYLDSHTFDGVQRPTSWTNNRCIAAVRTIVAYSFSHNYKLSNDEIDRIFLAFDKQIDALYKASCGRGKSAGAIINGAFLAALINGVSEEDISSFYSCFVLGNTNGSAGRNIQAPFKLAKAFMDIRERGGRTNTDKNYNLVQNAIWQYINAESTTQLRNTATLRYPVKDRIAEVLMNGGNDNA